MQCACFKLSSVACLTLQYFRSPHYLTNGTSLEKKNFEHKICFDFLYNFRSETFFVQRITEQHVAKNVYRSSCKAPGIPVTLQSVLIFFRQIF
jgi:hypothetical protein